MSRIADELRLYEYQCQFAEMLLARWATCLWTVSLQIHTEPSACRPDVEPSWYLLTLLGDRDE